MLKIRSLLFLAAFALAASLAGCLDRMTGVSAVAPPEPNTAVRFTPTLSIRVSNRFGSADELEKCEIVFSRTPDMQAPFRKFRLYKNETVTLEDVTPGDRFYAGCFVDGDGNLEPTYGVDPIGGAYSASFDPDASFTVDVLADRPSSLEMKLLRPITGRSPAHNVLGTGQFPEFSWTRPEGIARFEISVYDDADFVEPTRYQRTLVDTANGNALHYWRALTTESSVKYGVIRENKDAGLMEPLFLTATAKHKWSLVGLDAAGMVWAYAPGTSFLP